MAGVVQFTASTEVDTSMRACTRSVWLLHVRFMASPMGSVSRRSSTSHPPAVVKKAPTEFGAPVASWGETTFKNATAVSAWANR